MALMTEIKQDAHDTTRGLKHPRQPAVLLIGQNRSDLYLIQQYLAEIGDFRLYEASTFKEALKVTKYLSLDLIIIDDLLEPVDGYDIILKLNKTSYLAKIPKLMLLTEDFKTEKRSTFYTQELDYIKKPIDRTIFRRRVENALRKSVHNGVNGSLFSALIELRFAEAKSLIEIYKSLFEIDENILCVYDSESNSIVEFNHLFTQFFGSFRFVNRVLSSPRLLRRFAPYMSESNFINHFDIANWLEMLLSNEEFAYLLRLRIAQNSYTFNLLVKPVPVANKSLYLLKLINHAGKIELQSEQQRRLDRLREYLLSQERYRNDDRLLALLGDNSVASKLTQESEEQTKRSLPAYRAFDLYQTLLSQLLDSYSGTELYLEGERIHRSMSDLSLKANIDKEAFIALTEGLFEYYIGEQFKISLGSRVDLSLEREEEYILFSMRIDSNEEREGEKRFFERLFKKEESIGSSTMILPKKVEWAVEKLDAKLKHNYDGKIRTFLVTIPLKD
ncbi:MAG: hypothetical protein B6D59_02160 [Campylobacteraceae bacterium 4484_4]|nr:MAG: hypothetical protein B6D59_02160 [Campylobacteraceae bacterium 4484_4]